MLIEIRAHHTDVSDYIRQRTESGLRKLGVRAGRATSAIARFSEDGAARCVELELHTAAREPMVGAGRGRYFGPALTSALQALLRQIAHAKGTREAHVRREAATRRVREA